MPDLAENTFANWIFIGNIQIVLLISVCMPRNTTSSSTFMRYGNIKVKCLEGVHFLEYLIISLRWLASVLDTKDACS